LNRIYKFGITGCRKPGLFFLSFFFSFRCRYLSLPNCLSASSNTNHPFITIHKHAFTIYKNAFGISYIQSLLYKMVDIWKLNMHNIVFQNDGWWTSNNNLHTLRRYNLKNWKTEQRFDKPEQRKCKHSSQWKQ